MGSLSRALVIALLSVAAPASAAEVKSEPTTTTTEPAKKLEWKPTWTRFRVAEYIGTPIVGGFAVYRLLFVKGAQSPHWTGPILFDGAVRDSLRVRDKDALARVRLFGDIFTIAPVIQVMLVDSIIVPAARGSLDVAWQMTAMNAEAFAVSGLVVNSLFDIVARARPSYDECQAKTTDDPLCNSGRFADFPSGHTATAFTAAGLSCAHHLNLDLYGGGAADIAACVGSLAMATSVGVFRIVGDRHYFSDVFVGGGIGFLFGFGLPSLLHYHSHPVNEVYSSKDTKVGVTVGNGTTPLGASAFGLF